MCLVGFASAQSHESVTSDLTKVIDAYKADIFDAARGAVHAKEVYVLSDQVYDMLQNKGSLTDEAVTNLKDLEASLDDVANFMKFTSAEKQVLSIDDLQKANRLIGGEVMTLDKTSCMPVARITINGFVIMMLKNNTGSSPEVNFNWLADSGTSFGKYKITPKNHAFTHIMNNRSKQSEKGYAFKSMTCSAP